MTKAEAKELARKALLPYKHGREFRAGTTELIEAVAEAIEDACKAESDSFRSSSSMRVMR